MAKEHLTILVCLSGLILSGLTMARAENGVEATSIRLSADSVLTGLWIDGRSTELGGHAADWTQADEYGPRSDLRCLAVSVQSGPGLGRAGFIGAVVLKDRRWVVTDGTWRAWKGAGPPPADAKGRLWTAPDYNDHSWPLATEIGPYGIGPWGCGNEAGSGNTPESKLDAAMRQTSPLAANSDSSPSLDIPSGGIVPAGTDINSFLKLSSGTSVPTWNATWIWAGPPLGGATTAYFRKDFACGAQVPPNRPQHPRLTLVTPTSFTLAWQPSFSTLGPLRYELAWNGQVMLTTSDTYGTVEGITINPTPQNYAWVRAIAPDGTRSPPSSFVLIATRSRDIPGAPAHLRVTGRTASGLSVAWDPATDRGQLDGYTALVNDVVCVVPPGVCSLSVRFEQFLKPGMPVKVTVSARDIGGASGPAATVEDWILARTPVRLPAPGGLHLESGRLRWDASPAASAYRLWRDGTAVSGQLEATHSPLPAGEAAGFVQVMAIDASGNASPRSSPLLIGHPLQPQAPVISDGGHSGDMAVLRWLRPAAGTCVGYRIEQDKGGAWSAIAQIDDPWQNEFVVGNREVYRTGARDSLPSSGDFSGSKLEPGASYLFRVVALTPDGQEVDGAPFHLATVAPPSSHPRLRFAVIVATDGRYDYLNKSLADADQAGCAFALIKGQIVPQLSADPKQWDAMMTIVRRHQVTPILSLLASKDGWNEINDYDTREAWEDDVPIMGRYDMGPWRTGQPLDQLHMELGGAARMAGFLENPHTNPDFLPDLEHGIQDAEGDNSCRWFFTSGVSTESAPAGIPRVILELYRPGVDFMRMINGDRGHELALDPGSAVACACPQRNRVGAHYLVTVEDKRLVFESRQYDPKTKAFITDGLQEIAYDRDANLISAANLRIPYPFGIVNGLPQRLDATPPWTQNRILSCASGAQVEVRLLGRSPRGARLNFTVTRPPANGTLTGTGDKLVYHPATAFKGEDLFLYRADDGGPWPGNTAWVRITVGEKEQAE